MNDSEKHVIVSGGSKGIGLSISKLLLSLNYKVSVICRHKDHQNTLNSANVQVFDFSKSNYSNLDNVVKDCIEWGGKVYGLVNNVGKSSWKKLNDITTDFWEEMLAINTKSTVFLTQSVVKQSNSLSSIVNISSLAGKRGSKNNSVYCASKFAINGITQSLAKELGTNGIRVNSICPVYVTTNGLIDALNSEDSPTEGNNPELYFDSFIKNNSALKRLPKVEEIAKTCSFLLSNDASAITGQCLNVDCGVLPQ